MIPLWAKVLAVVALLSALWGIDAYRLQAAFQRGYDQAGSEDAKLAAIQEIENRKKELAHDKQLADALRSLDAVQAQLVLARRTEPLDHVVCSRAPARAHQLPAGPGVSAGEARDAGLLPRTPAADPQPAAESFDPTDELIALMERADDVLANCRYLHQAVHGIATAP